MSKKKKPFEWESTNEDLVKVDDENKEYKDNEFKEIDSEFEEVEEKAEEQVKEENNFEFESKVEFSADTQVNDKTVNIQFDDKEIQNVLKSFETKEFDDDEFTIDPRTGSRAFKLDENGCRKGWEWDTTLGRCVPKKIKK